jgi:hypothetical protein
LYYYLRAGEMDESMVIEKEIESTRDRIRLERALVTQDRLREKWKAWDGLGELRRWR